MKDFPSKYTVLLAGPPGVGKYEYCLDLVKHYLERGESVVYITTERSPQEIKEKLREEGFDLDTYEASKFLFIDVYSYSTGTKYDKGLHIDNPANLNLINVHLANAAGILGKPMRIFFDSLSALFLHAPVGEIKKFMGVLSSRAKAEYGFVLYTLHEGQHDEQTVMALRAMVDAVLEMAFEEGPPLKRRFRVHHAKGIKTTPTWYIFDIERGFEILGEESQRAMPTASELAEPEVTVERVVLSKRILAGVLLLALLAMGLFLLRGEGESIRTITRDIYSLELERTVNVGDKEVKAYIKIENRIDQKAPSKGWLVMENPYYRIELNLDQPYYLLYDKLNERDLLVYNDEVESTTDMLTGSTLGYADYDAENLVPFSSLAFHDESGIDFRIIMTDEERGFVLIGTEGWDFQTTNLLKGYDVEAEELFGLFADVPYYIDAVEVNNLQHQGYARPISYRSPDGIVKDWVLVGEYDSAVIIGGDPEHMNKEMTLEWHQVQTVGGVRKPWHAGSADFSKMFPDHVVVGNKLDGGIIFSLPQGKFRFDDSLGMKGTQVALEFLILVESPQKAIGFTVEPVSREAFFYDIRDYNTVEGYPESMTEICDRYGLECPGVIDAHDWEVKRFAYVVTLVSDWYDPARNLAANDAIAIADAGLEEFKRWEELIYNQMTATKPLISRVVVR